MTVCVFIFVSLSLFSALVRILYAAFYHDHHFQTSELSHCGRGHKTV